jgi:hypothetical protein
MENKDAKEYQKFIKNISIFFIIIEVLAGIGAFALVLFLTDSKAMSVIIGVGVSAWITYILIEVSKALIIYQSLMQEVKANGDLK